MKKEEYELMYALPNDPTEYIIQGRVVPVSFKICYSIEINGHDENHMTEQDKSDLLEVFYQIHLRLLRESNELI